jgi:hypothetical protein
MRTISQAVEEVLTRSPFLLEAISEGVANNAQVARRIRPEVEKKLLQDVSDGAIAMAIHRLEKDLHTTPLATRHISKVSDLIVRSNLVEFVFENSSDSSPLIEAITREAQNHRSSFLNFSRGVAESMIIVSSNLELHASKTLKKLKGLQVRKGLSAITMRLPDECMTTPGFYYLILKALTHAGINITEVVSVLTEFSIIIEDKDVDRAFSVIKRLQ